MDEASTVGVVPLPFGPDLPLIDLERWWRTRPDAAERIGFVLRRSFDEVLDGQRTGRYLYEDLAPDERDYVGSKVVIVLRDEFDLQPGPTPKRLGLTVAGSAVDCRFATDEQWAFPVSDVDELCVVIVATDQTSTFSFGVLRCSDRFFDLSQSSDRLLNAEGRMAIKWLWRNAAMPSNFLRSLPAPTVQAIMALSGRGNGQARIDELFRRVHGVIVSREVVQTVGQQADYMKRSRDSRKRLQPEGIIVLGHQNSHPAIAEALGLPVPHKGDHVAVRLIPATPGLLAAHRPDVVINGSSWVVAEEGEKAEPGPTGNY